MLRVSVCPSTQVQVCTPVLPHGLPAAALIRQLRDLLDAFLLEKGAVDFVSWYYTPMAREFSNHLQPALTVYDCMDELSAFADAPSAMSRNEHELFEAAALVFTGGASLFESKRKQHACVYLYPSSVDVSHFTAARSEQPDPADQRLVPHPRIGYAGVIDERMDLNLLRDIALLRPEWQLVLLGPVVKVDPGSLPQAPNIHYLGMKSYTDLPAYFSHWEIGMLPFARNQSTRYISPTKTPEYLAAGLKVISTPIQDVVKPYGDLGLVGIAHSSEEFVATAQDFLQKPQSESHLQRVDAYLALGSWDKTFSAMSYHMSAAIEMQAPKPEQRDGALLTSPVSIGGVARV